MQDSANHAAWLFVRHGSTWANTAGKRCGGDWDLDLDAAGIGQAADAAARLMRYLERTGPAPCRIAFYTAPLRRTLATTDVIRRRIGPSAEVRVRAELAERRIGEWNGRPLAETATLIAAGATPPGGESEAIFRSRVRGGLDEVACAAGNGELPIVISSRGVARIACHEIAGFPNFQMSNGEILVVGSATVTPLDDRTR